MCNEENLHHSYGNAHIQHYAYDFIESHEVAESRNLCLVNFSIKTHQWKDKVINLEVVHSVQKQIGLVFTIMSPLFVYDLILIDSVLNIPSIH